MQDPPDDDPAVWLAQQSRLLSQAKKSKNPAWATFDDALKVAQRARRGWLARAISIGGELSLFGLGIVVAFFVTFATRDKPTDTRHWITLVAAAVPLSGMYLLSLYERFR